MCQEWEYERVPNQKKITIHREDVPDSNFFLAGNEVVFQAMKNLKKSGSMKLWLLLSSNAEGFGYLLSRRACADHYGIVSNNAYDAGVAELIEKGYLVQSGDKPNNYDFYQVPQEWKSAVFSFWEPCS